MRNEMVVDCVIGTIGETTFPGQTRPISTHHNEGVISAKASFFAKLTFYLSGKLRYWKY